MFVLVQLMVSKFIFGGKAPNLAGVITSSKNRTKQRRLQIKSLFLACLWLVTDIRIRFCFNFVICMFSSNNKLWSSYWGLLCIIDRSKVLSMSTLIFPDFMARISWTHKFWSSIILSGADCRERCLKIISKRTGSAIYERENTFLKLAFPPSSPVRLKSH